MHVTLKIQLQKLILPHCDLSALWPGSISWTFFWLFLLIQNVAAAVSVLQGQRDHCNNFASMSSLHGKIAHA